MSGHSRAHRHPGRGRSDTLTRLAVPLRRLKLRVTGYLRGRKCHQPARNPCGGLGACARSLPRETPCAFWRAVLYFGTDSMTTTSQGTKNPAQAPGRLAALGALLVAALAITATMTPGLAVADTAAGSSGTTGGGSAGRGGGTDITLTPTARSGDSGSAVASSSATNTGSHTGSAYSSTTASPRATSGNSGPTGGSGSAVVEPVAVRAPTGSKASAPKGNSSLRASSADASSLEVGAGGGAAVPSTATEPAGDVPAASDTLGIEVDAVSNQVLAVARDACYKAAFLLAEAGFWPSAFFVLCLF